MKIFEFTAQGRSWLGSENFHTAPGVIDEFYASLQGEERELFERICNGLPCAKAYMEEHSNEYGWTKEMLAEAKVYIPAKLPRPVPYFEKPWCCYENSFQYAEEKGLRYVEGIAINPTGVQLHAWNSTDGVDVLDYTWPFQHVNKYFGIEWDIEWLKKHGYTSGGFVGYLYEEVKTERAKGAA